MNIIISLQMLCMGHLVHHSVCVKKIITKHRLKIVINKINITHLMQMII